MNKKLLISTIVTGFMFSSLNKPFELIEPPAQFKEKSKIIQFSLSNIYHSETMKKLEQKVGDVMNYRISNFHDDTDIRLLARLILGEAEGCSESEKISVAYTVINRAKKGKTLKEIILAPYQYSCFNENMDSNKFLKNPMKYNSSEFIKSLKLSEKILAGKYPDFTNGATHYYNPSSVKKPSWAKKLTKIGKIKNSRHIFYK